MISLVEQGYAYETSYIATRKRKMTRNLLQNQLNSSLHDVDAKLSCMCPVSEFGELSQLKGAIEAAISVLRTCGQSDIEFQEK